MDGLSEQEFQERAGELWPVNRFTAAPHLLSPWLTRRIPALSRRGAIGLFVSAAMPVAVFPLLLVLLPVDAAAAVRRNTVLLVAVWLVVLMLELGRYGVGVLSLICLYFILLGAVVASTSLYEQFVLHERGHWMEVTVVGQKAASRSSSESCSLRSVHDGTVLERSLGDCGDLSVGDRLRVFADPEGYATPTRHPGESGRWGPATVIALNAALSAAMTVTVGLAAGLGHWRRKRSGLHGRAAGDAEAHYGRYRGPRRPDVRQDPPVGPPEAEQRLRELLRSRSFDRRGYIRVSPGGPYRGITQQRAARIAREEGLRAEALGNRGYWRFAEEAIEEVEGAVGVGPGGEEEEAAETK
ncbi:hypothetical protein [Streptomyces sp. NBC_00996]|uniref:hypothetical protein n=1 Tax=Streptomyces sp. NBC_00996 TaxID=2903710 RepID=UPI00386E6241|nr:hypothetical protein OG390_24675 [Streptomyces sp. NBC_00996]